MPDNFVDSTGLHIQTIDQIKDEILNGAEGYPGMYEIYGADINVDPNTPDGQMINIIAQAKLDMLEFINSLYASFDPNQAVGVLLDQRCALNGVIRNAGTYTYTNVEVTSTQALTLPGLDTAPDAPFAVSDASGNRFLLTATTVFGSATTQSLLFRAAVLGEVLITPNTLTVISTITQGISAVNNPAAPTQVGSNEETDYNLRLRRANSTALGAKGFLAAMYGAIGNVEGVASSSIQENVWNHTLWIVVDGGTNAAVANAIYIKRNAGVRLIGSVVVPITQEDGTIFNVLFDRPIDQDLWISVTVDALTGTVDPVYIRSQLLQDLSYRIGASADTSTVIAAIKAKTPNASVTDAGLSLDGVTYVDPALGLAPSGFNYRFVIESAHILINGIPGT